MRWLASDSISLHCNTLQHATKHPAAPCNTMQHTATMYCDEMTCIRFDHCVPTLQHTATHYKTPCNTLQHTATMYSYDVTCVRFDHYILALCVHVAAFCYVCSHFTTWVHMAPFLCTLPHVCTCQPFLINARIRFLSAKCCHEITCMRRVYYFTTCMHMAAFSMCSHQITWC